jgi:hypothetical protein
MHTVTYLKRYLDEQRGCGEMSLRSLRRRDLPFECVGHTPHIYCETSNCSVSRVDYSDTMRLLKDMLLSMRVTIKFIRWAFV